MFIIIVGNKAKEIFDYQENFWKTHKKGYLPFIKKPKPEDLLQRIPSYPNFVEDELHSCFRLHDNKFILLKDFIRGYSIKPEHGKGYLGIDEENYGDRLEELLHDLHFHSNVFHDWVVFEATDKTQKVEGKEHFLQKMKEYGEEGRYFNISGPDFNKVYSNYISALIDASFHKLSKDLDEFQEGINNVLDETREEV